MPPTGQWLAKMALQYPPDLNDALHGHQGPRAERDALHEWIARLLNAPGDDPPAPTVCPECGEPSTTNKWCLVCVPTSDDPPAPTAQWTVDMTVPADTRLPLWDGKAVIAGDVLTVAQERALVDVLVRRAEATPDLTALSTVIRRYHDGWRDLPHGGEIRWVREGYRPDVIRESQPITPAEAVVLKAALVREDTDHAR